MCVFSSHLFWTSDLFWTCNSQGHPGFLIHLPSVVLALISLARRIQPSLSLVDHEVESCVLRPFLMLSKNAVEKDPFQTQLFTASIFRPAVLILPGIDFWLIIFWECRRRVLRDCQYCANHLRLKQHRCYTRESIAWVGNYWYRV